jgi:hypothetical protein
LISPLARCVWDLVLGIRDFGFGIPFGAIAIEEMRMQVGVMSVHIYMQGVGSLKEKRHIVKSVIGRLQSRFNVSVSEVEHQDSHTSAVLGLAVVSNERAFVDRQLDAILTFMRNDGRFYLGQVEREVFS